MSKNIVILGGAESGTGAAVLSGIKGFKTFLSDAGTIKSPYRSILEKYDIEIEEGKHTESRILEADEIIKSPGIPESAAIIRKAKMKGIPVISEIEFASRFTKAVKVCVTGSNGKTTTSSLIYHIMSRAGLKAGLAGNIGSSFALQVAQDDKDYYSLELSSFQLDGIVDFKPDISIILNITPDHLDRYDYDMTKYIDSKFRIIKNIEPGDAFVWCADDPVVSAEIISRKIKARHLPFSLKEKFNQGAFIENNDLIIKSDNSKFNMAIEELSLKGKHNTYNSMAAGISGQLLRIRKEMIRESLSDFQGIEHRLEFVSRVRGIDFINDSKATNVNSTWYALESMENKVVWIVGGVDKGNDYSELDNLVLDRVRAIVCLGKNNSSIINAFTGKISTIVETYSMQEAVRAAYYLAKNSDTVLLSPACASFDLFDNYEDRGRQFKACVRDL